MNGKMLWVTLLVVPALTAPAQAGLFGKKPVAKTDPAVHVPELLYKVKMDPNEKNRIAAAEELRDYDGQKFPDIAPILVDVLQTDKSSSVRSEAAHTLGRLRPVSLATTQALENVAKKDAVMRVRMQAWTGLRLIHLAGSYPQAPKDAKGQPSLPMTANQGKSPNGKEEVIVMYPPNAPPGANINVPANSMPANNGPIYTMPANTTPVNNMPANSMPAGNPATPVSNGKASPPSSVARPMPSAPSSGFSTAVPNPGQRVNPPDDGPALTPPPLPRN